MTRIDDQPDNRANAAQANDAETIQVENINVPGYVTTVKANMYRAMRVAMLKVMPDHAPGLTQMEIREAVLDHYLPEDLYPGGAKAAWWAKTVQLDLEAKGVLGREPGRPLRWHRNDDGKSLL